MFPLCCLETRGMIPVLSLLHHYLDSSPGLFELVYDHSRRVADLALSIVAAHPELEVDVVFLEEAALLHDIGVFNTHAPTVLCKGTYPYMCHGYLGRELLEKEGYPRHALVCERHVGTGLTLKEIMSRNMPLPHRDMQPQSVEEELVCFSDLFFSKSKPLLQRTSEQVRSDLEKYGAEGLLRFDAWCKRFL